MSYDFRRTLRGPITAELAAREPIADQLFATTTTTSAARQLPRINKAKYRPWAKPEIERVKR